MFYFLLTDNRLHPPQILCPPQNTLIDFNHVRSTESFELAEEQVGLLLDCSKSDSSRLTTHNQARSVKERRQITKIDRQRIRTALELGYSVRHISEKMGFSQKQIYYVKKNGTTPRHNERGRMPKIPDQKARQMVTWLLSDPANRRVKFSNILSVAPELELRNHGKKAIQTAFRSQGL